MVVIQGVITGATTAEIKVVIMVHPAIKAMEMATTAVVKAIKTEVRVLVPAIKVHLLMSVME
jgi:hypothetical protein